MIQTLDLKYSSIIVESLPQSTCKKKVPGLNPSWGLSVWSLLPSTCRFSPGTPASSYMHIRLIGDSKLAVDVRSMKCLKCTEPRAVLKIRVSSETK